MDFVGLALLLVLVGIGAFAIFKPSEFQKIATDLVATPTKETKKPKKHKKSNKKKSAAKKAEATAEAGVPAPGKDEAAPQPAEGSAPANDDDDEGSSEDEGQDSGVNFLGLDDVLPNSRGVYAVQGTADDAALLDGWEMVDTVKYNIPRADTHGNRGNTATTTSQTGKAAAAHSSGGGASKSRNDRRREKEQLVRQGIQQKKAGGASVAERMGTSIKRDQKEPHTRNTVPGM